MKTATIDGIGWTWAASLPSDFRKLAAMYSDMRAEIARIQTATVETIEEDLAWQIQEQSERYGKLRAFKRLTAGQVAVMQAASTLLASPYLLGTGATLVNQIASRHA